jgi:hypothetical protein
MVDMHGMQADKESTPIRQRLVAALGTLVLVLVVVAPAAASWHGLTGWGRDHGAAGGWAYLVPLVVDGAAAYAAWLAMRDVLHGRSAMVDRLLVWAYALGSAAMNAVHADAHGGVGSALFFVGAAGSAVLLWDRTLRHARWAQLDELGLIEAPLPRFRALRWALAPRETFGAWRLAVCEGAARPDEALALYRARKEGVPTPAPRVALSEPLPELAGLSKVDALRTAWAALDIAAPGKSDVRPALTWLADRGVVINESYAYNLARKETDQAVAVRRAAMRAAGD